MTAAKKSPKPAQTKLDDLATVEAFSAVLGHPLQEDIRAAGQVILAASPDITPGIKWNAPSFRTTEWFATTNLRSLDQVQFIFHFGAKKRPTLSPPKIEDPANLIKWLASDRAMVSLGAGALTPARRAALTELVRAWIAHV